MMSFPLNCGLQVDKMLDFDSGTTYWMWHSLSPSDSIESLRVLHNFLLERGAYRDIKRNAARGQRCDTVLECVARN